MLELRRRPAHLRRAALAALALAAAACGSTEGPSESFRQPYEPGRALFTNGDFATGDFTGWTVTTNLNNSGTTTSPFPPASIANLNLTAGGTNKSRVITGATNSVIPNGLTSASTLRVPRYGTHVAVVNEGGSSNNTNTLKQTMTTTNADVDPSDGNVHVRFAVAPVLQNPGHANNQQPYFWVQLKNVTRSTMLFETFNFANQPGIPWKSDVSGTVQYTDWKTFDISPGAAQLAVGDQVELQVIAAGCSLGGHWGEVYVESFGPFLPGLSVSATAPQQVNSGSDLTYTLSYENSGPGAATNVIVAQPIPTGTTFKSVTAPGATCTTPAVGASSGTVTCNVGSLNAAAAGSIQVTFTVTAASGSTVANGSYTVAADGVASLLGSLVSTTVTSGVQYADLSASISDGVAAVVWGGTVTYTVTVANAGPVAANAARFQDPIPANVASFSWTCAAAGGATCAASGTGAIDQTVNLPSGGSLTYVITAQVAAGSGSGSITETATVSTPAGVTDPNGANNVAVDVNSCGTLYTLSLAKAGLGTGQVVSVPVAIDCGSSCSSASAQFLFGTSVVLTATASPGNTFTGWGGACTGTGNTCSVTLSAATSVTASFDPPSYAITTSASPAGSGTLTCPASVFQGQPAVCTVAPAAGFALGSLTDNGTVVTSSVSGGQYTIAAVAAAHTLAATFVKIDGTSCAGASECGSGFCVDGVCCDAACGGQCQACNLPGKAGTCSPTSGAPVGARPACTSDGTVCGGTCDGMNVASCSYPSAPTECRGAACAAGTETLAAVCNGAGACPPLQTQACGAYACQATACGATCVADADCAAGNWCSAGSCVPQKPAGSVCGGANQCATGVCADGVCCGGACNGQCESCNLPGKAGTCSPVVGAPQGGRAACSSDGTSCGGACDGVARAACTYPGAATQCRSASCAGGTATLSASCAGTGSCPPAQTQSCGGYACGATACNATCSTDSQCASGSWCSSNACVPQKAPGTTCTAANQCGSGNCVDGVCCGTACGGQCEACNLPGSLGTCTAVVGSPQGGRAACASDGSSCGGSCDGSSRTACTYPSAASQCRAASCTAGTATLAAACDGAGSCPPASTQSCGSFACAATACNATCSTDAQCAAGSWCSSGTCVPQESPGGSCSAANQCASGNCVDGVCCDTACGGQCEACNLAGAVGTCTPVAGAPQGSRPACASDDSSCGGTCDGSSRTACAYPGTATECRAGSCSGGTATLSATCAGTGACPAPVTQPCGAYACGAVACLGNCSTDGDCASGSWCSGGVCVAQKPGGGSCGAADQCASGSCADGVCCDAACTGACEACDVAGSVGTCTPVTGAPHGGRPACASDGSACGGACDGANRASCTYPVDTTVCSDASCTGGTATLEARCGGSGSCPPLQTQACGTFACGATACVGTCAADNDCAAGNWCSAGVCVPKHDPGATCGAGNQCGTGFCADGVCCSAACNGQCEACDVASSVGTCTPVAGPPHAGRPGCASDATACAGTCDGANPSACAYPGASTVCRPASCTAGVATIQGVCAGTGSCPPAQTQACGAFACGPAECVGVCVVDTDCADGNWCSGGVCMPRKANGGSCGAADQCTSGLCVDGVCCDAACTGQCEACDVAGAVGTCTPATGAPRGSRTACATDGSVCGGSCDGTARAACAYPASSTSCRSASCAGAVETHPAACDGAGACPPRGQSSCGAFACAGSACGTTCTGDGDCASGSYCVSGACVGTGPASGWHVQGSGCSTGGPGAFAPGLLLLGLFALLRRRRGRSALLGMAALSLPLAAGAEANLSFPAQRFALAPGADDILSVYSARTAPPLGFDVLLEVDYANEPLRLVNGSTQVVLVRDQWNLQVAASLGILSWLELGLVIPATLSQSGQLAPMLDPSLAGYTPSGGFGDPRLVPHARLVDSDDFGLAIVAPITIPLGSTENYIGWDSVTVTPTAAAEWSGLAGLRVVANAGVAIRPQRTVGDLTVGTAFAYGAAGAYDFPVVGQRFTAMLTVTGEVGIAGSGAVDPVELLAAIRWTGPLGFTATLGAGPGLSTGYGTPNYRVLAMVGFAPAHSDERPAEKAPERAGPAPVATAAIATPAAAPAPAVATVSAPEAVASTSAAASNDGMRAQVRCGTGVRDRVLEGASTSFPATVGKVYCLANVANPRPGEVRFLWFRGDHEEASVALPLGDGSRWRTWSTKNIEAGRTGAWKVDVEGPGGSIGSAPFRIE